MKASFFKDKQKFAAAHLTLFSDGDAERLHGHNYSVRVAFSGNTLNMGLLAPFSTLKKEINLLCACWDEYVLLPSHNPWVTIKKQDGQVLFHLETPKLKKHYSFPEEDVVLLECDNISCENLALLFTDLLVQRIREVAEEVRSVEVTIGESSGQEVSVQREIPLPDGSEKTILNRSL